MLMKKQLKRWMLLLTVLVLTVTVSALLWPAARVYLAPKTVLTNALTDTYKELEQRYANSPILLAGKTIDLQNGNTIGLNLNSEKDLLGNVQYDMTVQMQYNPKRILASGQAAVQGKDMDLSVYLDGDFVALSSAGVLQGNYYGLTYDTFSNDIRSNTLLSLVLGDAMLSEWEEKVENLHSFMEAPWEIPTVQKEDLSAILVGIMALKAEVDREGDCFVISFETTGREIISGLDYLQMDMPFDLDPNDEVEISFRLRDNRVEKIHIEMEESDLSLSVGEQVLVFRYGNDGEVQTVTVNTVCDAGVYKETVTLSGKENWKISYNWEPSTGALVLETDGNGTGDRLEMTFTEAADGFLLITEDFELLMHLLLGTEDTGDGPCTMIVSRGAAFDTPYYKNFRDWSLSDLATLVSGVGSLFGLNIG